MKRLAVFLALGLLIIGAPAAGADNDDFDKLLRLAEQGDAEAQHKLGRMYGKGQGLSQNYSEAVKWYRKAAEQGLPEAQRSLGFMYAKGQGVPWTTSKQTCGSTWPPPEGTGTPPPTGIQLPAR